MSYKWHYIEETYGIDRTKAVPIYLDAIGRIPSICSNGIEILRGGEAEGGWAWAEFRCL